jgi:hypothetical protein
MQGQICHEFGSPVTLTFIRDDHILLPGDVDLYGLATPPKIEVTPPPTSVAAAQAMSKLSPACRSECWYTPPTDRR